MSVTMATSDSFLHLVTNFISINVVLDGNLSYHSVAYKYLLIFLMGFLKKKKINKYIIVHKIVAKALQIKDRSPERFNKSLIVYEETIEKEAIEFCLDKGILLSYFNSYPNSLNNT